MRHLYLVADGLSHTCLVLTPLNNCKSVYPVESTINAHIAPQNAPNINDMGI